MKAQSTVTQSFVLKSKYNELCLHIKLQLEPNIRDFVSKIRSYFSKQEKEVLQNIKNSNVSLMFFYDREKYVKRFISLYAEQLIKVLRKGMKRAEKEAEKTLHEGAIELLASKYSEVTLKQMVDKIETTTTSKLNEFYMKYKKHEITKEELLEQVRQYYDSDCKGWRAKEIALTECYRIYNYAYFVSMVMFGCRRKKVIACSDSPDSKTRKIHGQEKYILDEFEIPDEKNMRGLFPPLHPNSTATLVCLFV